MNDSMGNDYSIATASFEIIVLVLGAFLLGAMFCYLLRLLGLCCRRQKTIANTNTARDALRNSQTGFATPEIRPGTGPDIATPINTTSTAPSAGSILDGDRTVYGADINSLLRRSSDDTTEVSVERANDTSSDSFENRARESLANLNRGNQAAPASIDYTLDMPMPDDNQVDDLKKLEGIGPRIEKLLNDAGIKSYARLATMDRNHLKNLLEQGGNDFKMNEPKSWPYQAELAAKENWSRLKEYQAFLLDGRS